MALPLLSGCSSGMRAGLLTLKEEILSPPQQVRQTPLKPAYRYLLVESHGQEALLVWVGNEPGPFGDTSIWVSADGVVLRFAQGRLVGVSEVRRSWLMVSESAVSKVHHRTLSRQAVDRQPGLHLGIMNTIEKTVLPAKPDFMQWVEGMSDMNWVQEINTATGERHTVYAVSSGLEPAMAGQRCMTPEWCLRWQTWSAMKPAPSQ